MAPSTSIYLIPVCLGLPLRAGTARCMNSVIPTKDDSILLVKIGCFVLMLCAFCLAVCDKKTRFSCERERRGRVTVRMLRALCLVLGRR
jgi:putative copper export protein